MYRILDIIRGTTVDGPGFRTSIYMAGCIHHCEACQNPQSWDYKNGKEMSLDEIMAVVEEEDFNVTLSGGDPLYEPKDTAVLVERLKRDGRNVWVYTGYRWEDIIGTASLLDAVKEADVVVDGEFIVSQRNIDLPFRGSSNQRIIDVGKSLKEGRVVLFMS
ncbi:MAG: anaerobic ribonucleoside-triphosphate reductase activating protein [Muribaculaceae bacterium]|nr:anaerobic ribonucleoside-triphosphate reductase activating protein [Muribaculaceae bacterium]